MARIRETEVSGERFDPARDIRIDPPKRQGIGWRAWLGIAALAAAVAMYAYMQGVMG